jgi:hypothetical protein
VSASASNARKEGNISVCRCGYTAPGGTVGSGFPRLFRDVILMARGLPYCTVPTVGGLPVPERE